MTQKLGKGISLFILLMSFTSFGQRVPLGTWSNHFSYKEIVALELGDDKLFAASKNGFFYTEISDNSIHRLSKQKGLNDVGITSLKWFEKEKKLFVGYQSGQIDILSAEEIKNIPTISELQLQTSKSVNDFAFADLGIFVATDLGIAQVDLNTIEISDIYQEIGINGNSVAVSEIEILDDTIFAVTNQGLIKGNINSNLLDFNNWINDSINQYSSLNTWQDTLFAVSSLHEFGYIESGLFHNIYTFPSFIRIKSSKESLVIHTSDSIWTYVNRAITKIDLPRSDRNISKAISVSDRIYIGDKESGLRLIQGIETSLSPVGPMSDGITNVNFGSDIFISYGETFGGYFLPEDTLGWSTTDGNEWRSYELSEFSNISGVVEFRSKTFISSFSDGLISIDSDQSIQNFFEGSIISDMKIATDRLWLSIYDQSSSIYSSSDGVVWESMSSGSVGSRFPVKFEVTDNQVLWIIRSLNEGRGLSISFPKNSQVLLKSTSSGLPSGNINDIIIDRTDELWVATDNGIRFFPIASFISDDDEAFSPVFEGSLQSTQKVNTLEVDGGNRRWFGTDKGLWLFSEDLREEIEHFTSSNSPLPSNQIHELYYNRGTGEMFIVTSKGMVSYQTASADPVDQLTKINIFPNPIYKSRSGSLGLSNIPGNSRIKITTVDGFLVADFNSNGSLAEWNLRDLNNKIVPSGIYLIFGSDANAQETFIGKFAVVP